MRDMGLTGISDMASAGALKSRLKPLRGRAHGSRTCRIPHSGRSTRGNGGCASGTGRHPRCHDLADWAPELLAAICVASIGVRGVGERVL